MRTDTRTGTLLISLDFELMWGMFDKVSHAEYGANLDGVHTAIPALLELFAARHIHATWAVVGMVLCQDEAEWRGMCGQVAQKPDYRDITLSPYTYGERTDLAATHQRHFAPELVRAINDTPGQELASHTWSHYYCLEAQTDGGTVATERFAADCTTFATIAAAHHFTPTTMIFPRNQWDLAALHVLTEQGYTAYRGTEAHFIYRARPEQEKTAPLLRALRLLDRYCNLTGHHTYPLPPATSTTLINLPASRQLTPYPRRLAWLEPLRLRRIKRAMTHAARHGEVFHLWWHPHNFGVDQAQNLTFLASLLDHFADLQAEYGMKSCTLSEVPRHALG